MKNVLRRSLLLVASPWLPVSGSSCGGAEEVLWTLDMELRRRGWHTVVAACAGSEVSGELLVTGQPAENDEQIVVREEEHVERIMATCAVRNFEMVLDHSGSFFRYASAIPQKVLAALHWPRELYPADCFDNVAPNVFFHCVSNVQLRQFDSIAQVVGMVHSGIAIERFPLGLRRGEALLWIGSICAERAPHLAIQIAQQAGLPIMLAGEVYPLPHHREYWEREIRPLVDGAQVRWIEHPSFEEKLKLLRESRALLVTSIYGEASCTTALDAMACGTPVIALQSSALSEMIPRSAGFVVDGVQEAVAVIPRLGDIRARDCREWVEKEYSATAMADVCEPLICDLEMQRRWQRRRGED
jgi:glycosyltransferase involved in cell wall biosynthesis